MNPNISIKNEFKTILVPAIFPQQQLHYDSQYSQYMPPPPPMETPVRNTYMYRPPVLYQPQYQCQVCVTGAGASMPKYFHSVPDGRQNNIYIAMVTPKQPQPNPRNITGSAGDLSAYHLRNPGTSTSYQSGAGTSAHDSKQLTEDAMLKRTIRLMKNREAARQCRRKKKEYVRCLENRVALLENQNKALMDELRNLKLLYRHR